MTDLFDNAEPRLTLDLDALAANHRALCEAAGAALTAPVLKADAYGLGAAEVGRRLWAEGARSFFVARAREGVALRAALGEGRDADIYVLDGCSHGAAPLLQSADLIPVLNGLDQVSAWSGAATRGRRAPCALHIDTGMNRLGLRPEEARALADAPGRLKGLEIKLVMSHLACGAIPAHPMNPIQRSTFMAATEAFPGIPRSLAASGGAFLGPDYAFDMIRPGISLYGGGPFETPDPRIAPVATLDAPLLQVRTVRPGEAIGYGATFTVEKPTRIGIIALGYADGVLRSASGSGYGWLSGRRCDLVGRISMDLMAIDVSDVEDAAPGQRVELFGANLPVDTAAAHAGTIAYELLSRVSPRVRRQYLGAV